MRALPRRSRWGLVSLVLLVGSALPALPSPLSGDQAEAAGSRTAAAAALVARSYVGYPYAWIGDKPWTGFSCVGLVHHVYDRIGRYAPENLWSLYNGYWHLSWSQVQPGDVLLFANTVHAGLSHAAIYVGNGYMVGADSFALGVHVDRVYDPYWWSRYVTAVRP